MSDQATRILFMDDEPASDIVTNAVARLRAEGYAVDLVETLGEAIEAYYLRYYVVFILDIDMSHQAADEEGDGVEVLKRFVSLHNQTRVILFSGAGTVQHWFAAANAHCYAYIHKLDNDPETGEDSIQHLLRKVRKAILERPRPVSLVSASPPTRILLAGGETDLDSNVRQLITEALGADWIIDTLPLDEAAQALATRYGALLILQRTFSTRASVRGALARLLEAAPKPQTIVCCKGRNELRPSILEIANRHPFRLLDLGQPQWPTRLQDALRDARLWYDKEEIQQADPNALRRIHLILAEDFDLDTEDEDLVPLEGDEDLTVGQDGAASVHERP